MGAAGRGRRKVLGADPKIFREQVFFLPPLASLLAALGFDWGQPLLESLES